MEWRYSVFVAGACELLLKHSFRDFVVVVLVLLVD